MPTIVYYFQVHQPHRIRKDLGLPGVLPVDTGDIGSRLFDAGLDEMVLRRVAERCYLPMNAVLRRVIDETDGEFSCAFSISGTALEQMERWTPEVLDSFAGLAETGRVEFLCETSWHSLSSVADLGEFRAQVEIHRDRLRLWLGVEPRTFRNTELIFDSAIGKAVEELGFETALVEGAEAMLSGRSPHVPHRCAGTRDLTLIARDWARSDDIAFRFSNQEWDRYPLFAESYAKTLNEAADDEGLVCLGMDYETFGEHQSADTGILDFMEWLPRSVLATPGSRFATPAEVRERLPRDSSLDPQGTVSWADTERDLSAWLGNSMQRDAHEALYRLLPEVQALAAEGLHEPLELWRRLSTSDHVYYMSTKRLADGDVHAYFSPFESPFASYGQFTAALRGLRALIRSSRRDGDDSANAGS